MIEPDLPQPSGSRWRIWAAAALVLLVGAAVLLTRGTAGPGQDLASAPADADEQVGDGPGGAVPAPPDAAVGADDGGTAGVPAAAGSPPAVTPADRGVPVELRIPAIGVTTSIAELGLNPDRTVEVPTDYQQAGWFEPGPSPGQLGSSVVLGHVDSQQGPAVFFRLRSLRTGDAVEVQMADGAVAHFAVTAVETYPKDQFPAERVYGARGDSALQLVTCGGEFDRAARSYLSNVVAYTSLVAVTPAA